MGHRSQRHQRAVVALRDETLTITVVEQSHCETLRNARGHYIRGSLRPVHVCIDRGLDGTTIIGLDSGAVFLPHIASGAPE